jgi:hypothetical protein
MLLVVGLIALFLVGPPLLVVWLVLHLGQHKEQAQHRTIAATPPTPIAHARSGGLVALQGRAVASDQGTLPSPLSGRPALVCTLDIKEAHRRIGGSGGIEWRTIHKLRERREFWLDDGSGKRAWISPQDAQVIMVQTRYGGTGSVVLGGPPEMVVEMTPAVDGWARQTVGDVPGRLSVEDSVIEEGATIYALGWPFDHQGVLVLRHDPGRELLLSSLTETQLSGLLGARATGRRILLLSGCACLIGGLVMIAIAIVTSL